jgi:hypothetical protein
VLKDEVLRGEGNCAREGQIAEGADDQTSVRDQHTNSFTESSIRVEPPPALAGAHNVEAGSVLTCTFSAPINESNVQFSVPRMLPCHVEQLRGDVETGDFEPSCREPEGKCPRAGPEVQDTLPRFDPSVIFQPVEKALRESGPESLVIDGPLTEVDDTVLVIVQFITSASPNLLPCHDRGGRSHRRHAIDWRSPVAACLGGSPTTAARCEDKKFVSGLDLDGALG